MSDTNGTPTPDLPVAVMEQPSYPMVSPTRIMHRPCVQSIGLGRVRTQEGQAFVVMQIATPTGLFFCYLEPDESVQVGNGLVQLGSKTGIAVVSETSPLAQQLANAAFAKKNR